jgi:hypothetical protein
MDIINIEPVTVEARVGAAVRSLEFYDGLSVNSQKPLELHLQILLDGFWNWKKGSPWLARDAAEPRAGWQQWVQRW